MANDDVVDSLGSLPGDGHDGGVAVLLISLPAVIIEQLSFRAEDYASASCRPVAEWEVRRV